MELSDLSEEFNKKVNSAMSIVDNNKIASTVLCLFLVLYASLAAPKLPKSITQIFKSFWFKLIFMFLIAYMATHNPAVAIISAVALLITLQTLHGQDTADQVIYTVQNRVRENFQNFELDNEYDDKEQKGAVVGVMSTNSYDKTSNYAPYLSDTNENNKLPIVSNISQNELNENNSDEEINTSSNEQDNIISDDQYNSSNEQDSINSDEQYDNSDEQYDRGSDNQDNISVDDQVLTDNFMNSEGEDNNSEGEKMSEEEKNAKINLDEEQTNLIKIEVETFKNSNISNCNNCSIERKETFANNQPITGTCSDPFENLPGYEYGEYSSL